MRMPRTNKELGPIERDPLLKMVLLQNEFVHHQAALVVTGRKIANFSQAHPKVDFLPEPRLRKAIGDAKPCIDRLAGLFDSKAPV